MLVFVMSALVLALAIPATGQETPTKTRRVEIWAQEGAACPEGKSPCWDLQAIPVTPGDTIVLVGNLTTDTSAPHNLEVLAPVNKVVGGAGGQMGGVLEPIEFTFPANAKSISFQCKIHAPTMNGKLVIASELASAGGEAEVPHLGVNFLSYWVGVIAFMILFLVYGATFFLFKYNETPATTDHWDRPDMEGGRRFSAGAASMLALVIAAVLVGAVVWLARS